LSPIAGLTNLTHLGYVDEFCLGITALTTLTALTQLSITFNCLSDALEEYTKPQTQSALASVISALGCLRELTLPSIQAGPVTGALSQLTSLTKLSTSRLTDISREAPLVLPSTQVLDVPDAWVDVSALQGIRAARLQHVPVNLGYWQGQEAELKQAAQHLLQHCADLTLQVQQRLSEQDMVALMRSLKYNWRPSSTAMDQYHHVLPVKSGSRGHTGSPAWVLGLTYALCSSKVLEQVPPGITCLELR
jgi:hypothetical protein